MGSRRQGKEDRRKEEKGREDAGTESSPTACFDKLFRAAGWARAPAISVTDRTEIATSDAKLSLCKLRVVYCILPKGEVLLGGRGIISYRYTASLKMEESVDVRGGEDGGVSYPTFFRGGARPWTKLRPFTGGGAAGCGATFEAPRPG